MHITGLYAALLTLLVLFLAMRVVQARASAKVGIGDGGNRALALRIRVHANALENLPLALILLLILELDHLPAPWLHGFGVALVIARLLHAFGLSRSEGESFGRFVGTLVTWLAMAAMAALVLWRFFVWNATVQ